jgi:hypothetical protein
MEKSRSPSPRPQAGVPTSSRLYALAPIGFQLGPLPSVSFFIVRPAISSEIIQVPTCAERCAGGYHPSVTLISDSPFRLRICLQTAQSAGEKCLARKFAQCNPSDGARGNATKLRFGPFGAQKSAKNWTQLYGKHALKIFRETLILNMMRFYKMAEILLQTANNAWQAPR